MFAAAGEPRGHGAGLRRLVELRRRREERVGGLLHHRAHRGHRPDTGYAARPKELTGVKADRRLHLRGRRCSTRSPTSRSTLLHPITAVLPVDYVKEIGHKAFSDKPVGTGPYMVDDVGPQPVASRSSRTPTTGTRRDTENSATRATSTTSTCRSTPTRAPSGSPSRRATSTTRALPPGSFMAAQNNPEVTDGTWTAKGIRPRPSTSSAWR